MAKKKQLGDVRWEQAKAIYRRLSLARENRDLQAVADELNALGRMFEAPTGRPRLDFDVETFEKLCSFQCTLIEIEDHMKMSGDTIETRCQEVYGKSFSEVYKAKRGAGHLSLRRAQMKAALDGNPTMLVWLGKQHLGQQDRMNLVITPKEADSLIDDAAKKHGLPLPETFGGEPVQETEM